MTAKGMYIAAVLLFGLGSVLVKCTNEVKCNQWSQACSFERSTTVPSRPSKSDGHEARCLPLGASHQSTVLSFGRSSTFAAVQLNLPKRSTLSASHSCELLSSYEQGGLGNYLPDSEWNCQLLQSTPAAMGMSGRIVKLEDIYNLPKGTVHQFQSGISVLKIPAAHITGEESIKIPQGSAATIEANEADANDDVTIEPANVEKKLLVVRVKTEVSSTTSSAQRLSDSVFGTYSDRHNLASQFSACSFGKLTMSPLQSLNRGDPSLPAVGVYKVTIDTRSTDHEVNHSIRLLNDDWF